MTTAYTAEDICSDEASDVYPPQHDSHLLIEAMHEFAPPRALTVADLCTGTGVVAIAAAAAGAWSVSAFDLCPAAADCARANAVAANADVDVHHGSWVRAVAAGPFDLVLCNPPYVPHEPAGPDGPDSIADDGLLPDLSVNGGVDGRLVLDPLCAAAPALLRCGGTLLVVQSEFADVWQTVKSFRRSGLHASVVAQKSIPFGPVLHSRASWLEQTGRLQAGRRTENLAVVAAIKP